MTRSTLSVSPRSDTYEAFSQAQAANPPNTTHQEWKAAHRPHTKPFGLFPWPPTTGIRRGGAKVDLMVTPHLSVGRAMITTGSATRVQMKAVGANVHK
jgi:hypothetical protein